MQNLTLLFVVIIDVGIYYKVSDTKASGLVGLMLKSESFLPSLIMGGN